MSKVPSKKRRKELRKEYEKTEGERYVKELQKTHHITLLEWVEYKTSV